jgi:hypothetical protein
LACQELVSACMMAHVDTTGLHVPLWITSPSSAIGWGLNPQFSVEEGTFFGNIMVVGAHNWKSGKNVAALYCESPDLQGNVVAGRIGASGPGAPYVNPFGTNVTCDQGSVPSAYGSSACYKHMAAGSTNNDGYQACYGWNYPVTVFRTKPLEAERAVLNNGAWMNWCQNCSGTFRVSGLSGSGTITFNNVYAATTGPHTMYLYYMNGGTNSSAYFGVGINGAPMTNYYGFGPTGGDWTQPAGATITVSLKAGNNTIVIGGNGGQDQPDLDWITVQ